MKSSLSKYVPVALLVCFLSLSYSFITNKSSKKDVLPATSLKPFGRFQFTDNNSLELISSAVHFGFSFEGSECKVFASISDPNGHNYLQYELDGVYQKRVRINGNSTEPITIAAPSAGKHRVRIYKATEAHTGPIFIKEIRGKKLKALSVPKAPMIEFIGNSITCGAAADPSEVPCGTGVYHDQHNAYQAYGPRVARRLGINYILSSVSGIGIYRNWNSDGPTMPQVYQKVDFQERNSKLWDFGTYSPAIVSIALGTNDFSTGDGKKKRLPFDSASFVNGYIRFVQTVKTIYPKAQVALLSSAMVNGANRELLQNCLKAVKERIDKSYTSGKPVALYFFKPMRPGGCSGHPNVTDHAVLADELYPFFKRLL
jgi:hypothetical protein